MLDNNNDTTYYDFDDGTRIWRQFGAKHRVGGPAVERPDGTKEWWVNGHRHRLDGPAVERADGNNAWYIKGKNLDPIEHFFKALVMTHHE